MNTSPDAPAVIDLAGSLPRFLGQPGSQMETGLFIGTVQARQLLFNRLESPGAVHVYSARCSAGQRLRAQLFVPVLPRGGAVVPAFAAVAQSLPYSADLKLLPVDCPAGFSAAIAQPPSELRAPVVDLLTRVRYYPGPTLQTRTLVGGRCYFVVWSPHNRTGKYMLQVGQRWSLQWQYWLQLPRFWWQIRGWFGMSRAGAYGGGATAAALGWALASWLRRRKKRMMNEG